MQKYNKHYDIGEIQPWDVIKKLNLDFFEGNVLKYLSRFTFKGTPEQDLTKATNYLLKSKDRKLSTKVKILLNSKYLVTFLNQYEGNTKYLLERFFLDKTREQLLLHILDIKDQYNHELC